MLRIVLCLGCLATAVALRQEPVAEPPLLIRVVVDGQEHAFVDGAERALSIGGKEARVKVVVEPHRHFKAGGIEFDFPRDMAFEQGGEDVGICTLDGNDVVIFVHRHRRGSAASLARETLVEVMAAIDEEAKPPAPAEITLGGKRYQALMIQTTVGPAVIRAVAVGIDLGDKPIVLMVQDTLRDDGSDSPERTRVLQLLATTFKILDK